MSLNIRTEVGNRPWPPLALFLERRHRGRHVPVAGKRVIAGQLGEAIAVGVAQGFSQCALGITVGEEIEDAEALVGAGRGVEPGDERTAASLGLADAEAEPLVEPAMLAAVPDGLQVVGQVARKEELVRRRKTRHRARSGLRDQSTMPDSQVPIGGVG